MKIHTVTWLCLCCATVFSQKKYPVSFEDALHHRFSPDIFNGTWISSNEYIYEDENSLVRYNVETKQTRTLLSKSTYDMFNLTDVTVSADGKWIAVEHDEQSIFRHSSTSLYTLIEAESGQQYQLGNGSRIQLLVWAPVGSGLVFVMDNNVFYQPESSCAPPPSKRSGALSPLADLRDQFSSVSPTMLPFMAQGALRKKRACDRLKNSFKRITNSSKDVYNGVADWVYEEEVLSDSKALWFSPNGTKLIFATINDTNVRNVTFWKYGDPGSLTSQYVQQVVIKYPKVGTRNPVAYLNYVDLQSDDLTPKKIKAPEKLVSSDNILTSVSWADEDHFSMTWLERLQTKGNTLLCDVNNLNACKVVYSYHEPNGWLTIENPTWVNGSTFLTVLPQDQGGDLGNYRQLSLVQGGESLPLTAGLSVVTGIDCYDKANGVVYFSSTVNGDSAKKLVYKMNVNNPDRKECYSCRVQEDCAYGMATFSRDCAYAMLTCQGPNVPQFHIYDKDGKMVQQLNNNSELAEALERIELPTKLDFSVPVPGDFTARVRLLLPPDLDKTGRTKYPVLFSVYSGPDSNKITDAWSVPGYEQYLATQRNVVIAYLDGRGSGLRGDKLKFANYHKLGGPEIEDILIVGRYLQEHFPFVDPLRTAIWGWSYGGFATAMTLAKDDLNIFRCGISVAPVTNWIYYDTVYTERYMGLPTNESNLAGYQASDVSARVANFKHKLYYLIHGNADDNVHYQQSMMLSRALELADIMFFQQSYPDETHALSHVRRHLFHSMDRFWTRCFHLNNTDYLDPGLPSDLSVEYAGSSD